MRVPYRKINKMSEAILDVLAYLVLLLALVAFLTGDSVLWTIVRVSVYTAGVLMVVTIGALTGDYLAARRSGRDQ